MAKGPWETRVGKLISPEPRHHDDEPDFVWTYKPPDSQFYAGQPRLDWIACDKAGFFWAIEVKDQPSDRISINLETEVEAVKRTQLNAIASSYRGVAVLAVGQGSLLFVHSWSLAWSLYQHRRSEGVAHPERLRLSDLSLMHTYRWTGPVRWKQERIHPYFRYDWDQRLAHHPEDMLAHIQRMRARFENWSPGPDDYPLTSKLRDSTLTQAPAGLWAPLERLSAGQETRRSSSENSPSGGEKFSKTGIRRRSSSTASST